MPNAVLALSGGIGDIIRGSSLIEVLNRLGYVVDLILLPDYPQVRALYDGAPQIRQIFTLPFGPTSTAPDQSEAIRRQSYDLAIYKIRLEKLRDLVPTRRRIWPSLEFRKRGDAYFCAAVARKLGWEGPLPRTFALHSDRKFDLADGTVALHPGCNPKAAWKRWHGFSDLSHSIPHVSVIGSDQDRLNENTYFGRSWVWPAHVRDFTGLNLLDTAALLRQCRMLISNDSGMMHLSVAMGTLTFGIFGATRPEKELMPYAHHHAIEPSRPAIDPEQWPMTEEKRADGMERLNELTADEVLRKVSRVAGSLPTFP